ncbi:MAG: hypothetical protein RLZZ288_1019, partial [Planctomycetota bacterium]
MKPVSRAFVAFAAFLLCTSFARAASPEIDKALAQVPAEQRPSMEWL